MINQSLGYIFTHLQKTGGTSVSGYLMDRHLEQLSYIDHNFDRDGLPPDLPLRAFDQKSFSYPNKHTPLRVWQHYLPPQEFDSYFKFAFVRNPFYRLVSLYIHRIKLDYCTNNSINPEHFSVNIKDILERRFPTLYHQNHEVTFDYFIRVYMKGGALGSQLDYLCDRKGNFFTDFIGKIENIEQDFGIVCDTIGIPRGKISKLNSGNNDIKLYMDMYSLDLKKSFYNTNREEFEVLNYDYNLF